MKQKVKVFSKAKQNMQVYNSVRLFKEVDWSVPAPVLDTVDYLEETV